MSPELVLVSPELRDFAVARARTFPTAQSIRTRPTPPPAPEPLAVATAAPMAHSLRTQPAPMREPDRSDVVVSRRNRRVKLAVAAAALMVATIIAAAPELRSQGPTFVKSERRQGTAGRTDHRQRERRTKARASATRKRSARSSALPASRPSPPAKGGSTTPSRGTSRLKLEAERNVLKSPGFFLEHGGSGAALVDPATKLFHVNTTIKCDAATPGLRVLVCRVRRGRISVRLRYIVTGRKSFRLAPA
jgi:hypothetical protein